MRCPRLIYEAAPYLYIVAGVVTLAVGSPISFLSGLLFGIAGILVLRMRRDYRSQRAHTVAWLERLHTAD